MGGEAVTAVGAVVIALINGVFMILNSRKTAQRDAARDEREAERDKRDKALSGQMGVIQGEVKNHHSTNFRDDVTGIAKAVDRLSEAISDVATDVREVRTHSGKLFSLDRDKEKRLAKVENTVTALQLHSKGRK